jgi:putative membrane protein
MTRMRMAVSVLAMLGLWGCGDSQNDATAGADSAAPAPSAPAADAGAPTDAQIAAIVVTANSADSTAGELAMSKSSDAAVKEFAQRMVVDHGTVNQQAVALAQRLNLTPEAGPTSQALAEGAEQNIQSLQGLSGAAFDKAYIDHEVALHQQVLDALGGTLIPNAQNAELKALLEKGQPIFEGHLEMAKRIQASLGQP